METIAIKIIKSNGAGYSESKSSYKFLIENKLQLFHNKKPRRLYA